MDVGQAAETLDKWGILENATLRRKVEFPHCSTTVKETLPNSVYTVKLALIFR